MASDWVHCNSCFLTPATGNGVSFLFSSCGHLLCKKCQLRQDGQALKKECVACKKPAGFLEINRTLRPEAQMFFRNPSELASEYMTKLKKVLDFQSSNRIRLLKYTNEKARKSQQFIGMAQTEMKRRAEMEKKIIAERDQLKAESESLRMKYSALEATLRARQSEIEQLRRSVSSSPCDSGVASVDMSFCEFVTSTPIQGSSPAESVRRSNSGSFDPQPKKRQSGTAKGQVDLFGNTNELSPILAPNLHTPALLGLKKKGRRSSSAGRVAGGGQDGDFPFGVMDVDMGGC